MSYELCDARGPVGQLATTSGYADLAQWAGQNGGPALQELIRQGYTDRDELVLELPKLFPLDMPEDIRSTLENLYELAQKSDEIVIISGV